MKKSLQLLLVTGIVWLAIMSSQNKWTKADALVVTNNTNTTATTTPRRLPPPPRVKVNKCCHLGEHLDMAQSCVLGNTPHWVPMIFLINKGQNFALKGESPKFISFVENVRPLQDDTVKNETQLLAPSPDCSSADELELFTDGDNIILFSNGSLYLRERSQFIEPRNFCVDREAALVCFPPQNSNAPPHLKLKKCCGKHGIYNVTAQTCHFEKSNNMLQLPVAPQQFHTIYGFPKCREASQAFAIAGDFEDAQLNASTGELQLQQKNFSSADYCLEHIQMPGSNQQMLEQSTDKSPHGSSVKVFTCLHHFVQADVAIATAVADGADSEQLQVAVLNIGILISVIFLAATLIAGYLMPSVHHVLHWRCQIYYVFCLFVGDLLLAYTQLTSTLELGSVACTLIASIMHFFFLAAFFWLNTMCFNIWWTFRDFRPSSLERNQELFRLRLYSAYAWGIPLLIAVIAVCLDQLPADTQLLRPGFGVRSCWFSGESLEIFAYFFGPVGILLCANIMLFISTTHQLTCGLWKRDDVKSSSEKTALGKVCLKLLIVMGVTWIAEVISWLVGGPHAAWFVTDLVNALQGVFIFLVIGCQPQVWVAIKRLWCAAARQEITNTTNGVHHSSSSHGLPSLTACGETTQNTSINTTLGANAAAAAAAAGANNVTQSKIPMETVC